MVPPALDDLVGMRNDDDLVDQQLGQSLVSEEPAGRLAGTGFGRVALISGPTEEYLMEPADAVSVGGNRDWLG